MGSNVSLDCLGRRRGSLSYRLYGHSVTWLRTLCESHSRPFLFPLQSRTCPIRFNTHPGELCEMRYPAPKKVLYELATTGPSAVRVEALRLLGLPDLPVTFPKCERRSRESLLRRLAANRKKSAKARMAALKELLFGWTPAMEAAIQEIKETKQ